MRIRTIINPSAGRQNLQKNTDRILDRLLDERVATAIDVIPTLGKGDAYNAARYFQPWEADLVMAVGGDGTVNEVINGLIDGHHHTPLAILPAGTMNDFAFAMKIPRDIDEYCEMIKNFKTIEVDAGRAGNTCFLNVAAAGMLTDVAYKVPSEAKTALGQLAYILSGAIDLPAQLLRPVTLMLRSEERTIEEDILLFIVCNTSSVAGFRNLAPLASVNDGLLDVLVIFRQNILELVPLVVQMANGLHLNNPKIDYFQTRRLEITCVCQENMNIDIDGELGPELPLVIEALPSAIRLVIP